MPTNNTHHIVLSVSAECMVHASGTDNLVIGMIGDANLFNKIINKLANDPLPCTLTGMSCGSAQPESTLHLLSDSRH